MGSLTGEASTTSFLASRSGGIFGIGLGGLGVTIACMCRRLFFRRSALSFFVDHGAIVEVGVRIGRIRAIVGVRRHNNHLALLPPTRGSELRTGVTHVVAAVTAVESIGKTVAPVSDGSCACAAIMQRAGCVTFAALQINFFHEVAAVCGERDASHQTHNAGSVQRACATPRVGAALDSVTCRRTVSIGRP